MKQYFLQLAGTVCQPTVGTDRVTLYLSAESSDFIRFNHALVRQATHVDQRYGTVSVIHGQKRAASTVTLSGDVAADTALLLAERATLIEQLPFVPDDAYLLLPDSIVNTERDEAGALPTPQQVIDAVTALAAGTDLVGLYAGGPAVRAFADSRGQRNWHAVASFHFDWCLYHAADKAVKTDYAGTQWDVAQLKARIEAAKQRVALLAQPARTLAPGAYRVYFTPTAVGELTDTLGWGGFGLKALKTNTSTLGKLWQNGAALATNVHLTEDTAAGIAPRFQPDGFTKPDTVPLITAGRVAQTLNAPRSAKEYGAAANGAGDWEAPESLSMAVGTLAEADVLKTLGTGIYLSNLHYLNYSDRQACRVTGMSRFACFWVENGKLVAPINVMRFDDSVLRMFGEGLVALTDKAEFMPSTQSYGERKLASNTAPGAIVDGFTFTL
jgi:predicted Zn-dependent protease